MTDVETYGRRMVPRRGVDKFAERRAELADAALVTLSELGYARTSLREIAQHSAFSHGVLHYYFADKMELITACVRRYKVSCIGRYDEIVATAASAGELRAEFAAAMATTLRVDASLHRLWYDLRSQSLFEAGFQADVAEIDQSLERMIWTVLSQYAQLAEQPVAVGSDVAYALFDGLFQQALLAHLAGDADAGARLEGQLLDVMGSLVLRA